MIVVPLAIDHLPQLTDLMATGAPYIAVRTPSDYWAYATLFSSTCPVAMVGERLVGAVIAFRSQDNPGDIYIQDVAVLPEFRGEGVAGRLLGMVRRWGVDQGCTRMYLTSEPDNVAAHWSWIALGFVNLPGDRTQHGVSVIANFKGPGKDRAVYELDLRP